MKKHFIIVLGIAIVAIIIAAVLIKRKQPTEIIVDEISYKVALETFLEDSELISVRKEQEEFSYYELHNVYGKLQGFIFLGEEEGYIGPINLFVKTDLERIIQEVYVWQHTETPIFVPPVKLKEFLNTFANHKIDEELKWQTDIHGLTGATVTAESIIRAVHEKGLEASRRDIFNSVP